MGGEGSTRRTMLRSAALATTALAAPFVDFPITYNDLIETGVPEASMKLHPGPLPIRQRSALFGTSPWLRSPAVARNAFAGREARAPAPAWSARVPLQRAGAGEAHPSIGAPYPVLASIACTSAGRAKGSGAGSPGSRGRPMAAKKSSKPGGR